MFFMTDSYSRESTSIKQANERRETFMVAFDCCIDKKQHGVWQLCITGKKLSSDHAKAQGFQKEFS